MLLKTKADAWKTYRQKQQVSLFKKKKKKKALVPVGVTLERIMRIVEVGKRAPGP